MKTVLESTVENCVNTYAKKKYAGRILVRKMNGVGFRNWPDRLYFFDDGKVFLIEFKRKGKVPGPAQTAFHKILAGMGYRVYVVDNPEDGKKIIDAEAE